MMARGSAARGSNDPPPPATTYNGNTSRTYWKNQLKPYILEQLKISGGDPPHPDIDNISRQDLLTVLFKVRNIPENETQQTQQIKPKHIMKKDITKHK